MIIFCLKAGIIHNQTLHAAEKSIVNPFKVLVVIGDQWHDPMSYMVSSECSIEFKQIMILLKSWGIPFDVIRLDQQFLDRNMFLGPDEKPAYASIIWDVNNSEQLLHPNYGIITDMVINYGIGLIALSDRIHSEEIQSVLGLDYIGTWLSNDDLGIQQQHFITKGLINPLDYTDTPIQYKKRIQVVISEGTEVLVKQGPYPQVTVKTHESGSHCVWIGGDFTKMLSYQEIRTMLRRAITWTIGYNLYKTWENQIIMKMDDPGTAQCAWLEHWHYPTLSEEMIDKYLIKPLKEHDAVLNINVLPGFVNDEKRQIEPSWQQKFVDQFGIMQDYSSTKRGLDKGLELGVFQIMCHGLTHMQPDLSSPPGWWGGKIDQERSEVGWYREFGDVRRDIEIPAAEQLWRMKTASKWIEYQFGVIPLEFLHGGSGISNSYFNNTFRLAGQAGFGWYGFSYSLEGGAYLGEDMVIAGWNFSGTPDSPVFEVAPPDGHDFGITSAPEEFITIFEKYAQGRFIGVNEFIAYLHVRHAGIYNAENNSIKIKTTYDDHYCQHFKTHSSNWTLELSDWLIKIVDDKMMVKVDNKDQTIFNTTEKPLIITIPEGIGNHFIEISF
jgi:hypothetical protein